MERRESIKAIQHLEDVLGNALPLVIVSDPFSSPEEAGEARIAYMNTHLLQDLGFGGDLTRQPGTSTLRGLLGKLAEESGPVDEYFDLLQRNFIVRDHEIALRGPDEQRMVVQVSSRILGLVRGAYYMQGIFIDVTRRHALEAKLRRHQEMIDRDLDLAGWVQRSLIPNSLCTREATLEVRYVPAAHVGGDYVDFQFVENDLLYVTVCDVSGHGVAAALVANRVNSEVARWIREGMPPAAILSSLNWFLRLNFAPRGLFLSIFLGRVDLRTGEFAYIGAGHPPPYLIRAGGDLLEPLPSGYPLVGAVDRLEPAAEERATRLGRGDKVVLYTDGLFEVFGPSRSLLGAEGLSKILRRHAHKDASDLASALVDEVEAFRVGPRQDDISLLVVEAGAVPRGVSGRGGAVREVGRG